MKINYASYLLHSLGSLEEVVKKIGELGFGGVVFMNRIEVHLPSVLEIQSPSEMNNIRNIIEEYDLDVHLHIARMVEDARKAGKISLEDTVNYMKNRIQRMFEWMQSTGRGKVISFDCLRVESSTRFRLDLRLMLDILQITADMAAPYNIKVGFENLREEEIASPYELGKIVKWINRKNVGILLDIAHANLAVASNLVREKTLSDYIKAIPAKILEIHLHDNHGKKDEHLNPGEGTIDFESVFLALQDVGFKGNITLEAAIPKNERDPIEHIRKGKAKIEEILKLPSLSKTL